MLRKIAAILIAGLLLSACAQKDTPVREETQPPLPTEDTSDPVNTPEASAPPDEDPAETKEPERYEPSSIQWRMQDAIERFEREITVSIAGMDWTYGPENDLKNIYYGVLSDFPELKYAYDMEVSLSGNSAVCEFHYMPYKTGVYTESQPEGCHTVSSLRGAEAMAQSMIDGTERMTIAITDPSLQPEDIQLALAQAGYGWIRFDLSRDAAEIIARPPDGKTLEDCAEILNETFRLGGELLAGLVDEDMTDREKVAAVYDYLVQNVSYDRRWYSDRENMPYESTTAIGALRDHLAICGGYAQALETLLDMLGIENYKVTGTANGEYHMWNFVILDGTGYYCDPTADRGGMDRHFLLSEEELSSLGGYEWEPAFLNRIAGLAP